MIWYSEIDSAEWLAATAAVLQSAKSRLGISV